MHRGTQLEISPFSAYDLIDCSSMKQYSSITEVKELMDILRGMLEPLLKTIKLQYQG